MLSSAEVKRLGKEAGFDVVGIARADPFTDLASAVRLRDELGWIPAGTKEAYEILRRPDIYADPRGSLPQARSIISLALCYRIDGRPDRTEPGRPCGRLPRNAWRDFGGEAARRRRRFEEMLVQRGARCAVPARIPFKCSAQRAGTAAYVRSGITQAETYGPWICLTTVITDLELEPDESIAMECGTCRRCMSACPTKAIIEPYKVNAGRCLVEVLASAEWIPREVRPAVGGRISSCDTCMEVCPRALNPLVVEDRFPDPRAGWTNSPELVPLLQISDEEFRRSFADLDWNEEDPRLLKRNVIVALGNLADPVALPALERMLRHDDAMLRGHAAWALGRMGERARAALEGARPGERDLRVREELDLALAALDADRPTGTS